MNILHATFLLYASYTLFAIPTDINEYMKRTAADTTEPGKPTLNAAYWPQNLKYENMELLLCTKFWQLSFI
jgi:hypothetical protein